ncbi:MAG: zf-TFIIB domain-containing protein, partial [Deltaproteobacteria bacterium]|nr:zf-TFIIB domain-containing protein [Deltaproteobacteria bacterium]
IRKISREKTPDIYCPICGLKMQPRPFTYQYIIPVDKCFLCHKTWFDTDELEILQILIEKH